MPFPTAGFRWLNKQYHLALEEIRGEATEHTFGKEGRVLNKGLKNPLVLEVFMPSRTRQSTKFAANGLARLLF